MTKQVRIYLFLFLGMLSAGMPALGQGSGSAGEGIITMTTTKKVGEKIFLTIVADGSFTVEGAEKDSYGNFYWTNSQSITIRGNVTDLNCSNSQLTELNVSGCTSLTSLSCSKNQLTNLDVTKSTALKTLWCFTNQLTELDLSQNTALTYLRCSENQLSSLDLSKNSPLKELYCSKNQLSTLDLSKNTSLTKIYCNDNKLTQLELSANTLLESLYCYSNQLTTLDLSKNTALRWLYCNQNKLTTLDLSNNSSLWELECFQNQLTVLDLTKNADLMTLYCQENALTALELSKNEFLAYLNCSKNKLTTLDLSQNTELTKIWCSENMLTSLNISKSADLTSLECNNNKLTGLDVSKNSSLSKLICYGNQIKGDEMTRLINDLPNRSSRAAGELVVVQIPQPEGNRCLKSHVATAKAKNWQVMKINLAKDPTEKESYEGADAYTFAVTLKKEGEGMLNATGADDLNAVAYGTELTIEATPAEGYKLVALTANGKDILTTKKVVVEEATEVKAIFTQGTYAVKLTKIGEGTLNATGADDLNAVAYGTELAIEATPAEGYKLMALTANGKDILATKKFVVKATTEVKATFAKKTFGVTLTHEGEGMLKATGADNLNAVAYGTELTIVATPAKGYELTALTANGKDILATKKFVVKATTEVKATFAKKTYAVTLTKEGEGMLNATGADDLNAVPEGTELTIVATPAKGYELTALTANGKDILATKKFTVTANTEVKASFTKKTAADVVETGTLRLYPNPASAYVNVKGAKADALVRLYDANGALRYEARTTADGTLQIDLSGYAEGIYLLRVGDATQRLLIQR